MQTWVDRLSNVTFHNKLGTQAELISRMEALAGELAPMVGADAEETRAAARFAKADLSSEMVYEFPELQGLMGSYYAKAAGKSEAIAAAAQDHYAPLGPSDDVPTAPVSIAVALAEKIDKLTGFWAIDEKPTGSKDPFALRRAALGVIRILVENDVSLEIGDLLVSSLLNLATQKSEKLAAFYQAGNPQEPTDSVFLNFYNAQDAEFDGRSKVKEKFSAGLLYFADRSFQITDYPEEAHLFAVSDDETLATNLLAFLHDRLKVYLKDQGVRHDIIDACISSSDGAPAGAMDRNDDLTLLVKRAKALSETLKTDDGENLIQGFKRANNILSQAEDADGVEYSFGADIKFAETEEERALFAALDTAEAQIKPAMEAQDFGTAMSAMASLRGPIDAFFDAVQVNSDNATVRRNRLNLLSRIRTICSSVADLTKIDG